MIKKIPDFVLNNPLISLIIGFAVSLFPLMNLNSIKLSDNIDIFSIKDHQDTQYYEYFKKIFGHDEFFIIAFSSEDIFTSRILNMMDEITRELEDLPEVREVRSLTNVEYTFGGDDYFEIRPFLERIPESNEELQHLKHKALNKQLFLGNLISDDGNTTAIIVFPDVGKSRTEGLRESLLNQTQAILDKRKGMVGSFHLAGWTVTNSSLSQYMKMDLAYFIPATYLLITLTVWFIFRNIRLTLLALANISLSTGATMGLFPIFGTTLNNVTTIIPPLVMALALSDSVHIFAHLTKDALDSSRNATAALNTVLKRVILPCFLTSLTTAVGFASLAVSEIQPIQEFAYIATMGMVFEFFFSFIVIPPILLYCKADKIFTQHDQNKSIFFGKFSNFIQSHAKQISIISLLIISISILFSFNVITETNVIEYFKPSSIVRKDLNYIQEKLCGVGTMDVVITSKHHEAFKDPDNLKLIELIQNHALSITGVDRTLSFVDFLKDMNQAFHNDNPDFHNLPTSRELVAQYLLLYDSEDLEEFVTTTYDQARIMIRLTEHSSSEQSRMIRDLKIFVDQLQNQDVDIRITGRAVQDVNTIDALVQGQVESLALAAFVIFCIMFLALRSASSGALSIIPNIFPVILNFGVMGLLGIPLNTSTALISVVALGIAVDDTIHFLTEYNRKRAQNMPLAEALHNVTVDKGMAITASSAILVIGFSVLLLSNFTPTVSFGGLSALIMVTAWIGDIIVLPALMIAISKSKYFPHSE